MWGNGDLLMTQPYPPHTPLTPDTRKRPPLRLRSNGLVGERWAISPMPTHDSESLRVSSPGESHPEALAELYVSLSTHTAPVMEPRRHCPRTPSK